MIPRPKLGDDSIYTLGQGILPKNDCGRLRHTCQELSIMDLGTHINLYVLSFMLPLAI